MLIRISVSLFEVGRYERGNEEFLAPLIRNMAEAAQEANELYICRSKTSIVNVNM